MSVLKLKVELQSASQIEKAFEEGVVLANKLNLVVEFATYGVTCFCYPDTDYKIGVLQYNAQKEMPGIKVAHTKVWYWSRLRRH